MKLQLQILRLASLFRKNFTCLCDVSETTMTETCSASITDLIIKITISSVLIGLKKVYFPLIRLPSCYRTVCYWIVCYWTVCYRTVQKANHIQRCSLKQPITFKVVITCACTCACFCVFAFFLVLLLYFNANFPLFSQLGYFSRKL